VSVCRYEEALADAQSCTKLRPDFSKAYARAGLAQYRMNRLLDAKQSYEDGIKRDASSSALSSGLKDVDDALRAANVGSRIGRNQLISLLGDAAKVQSIVQHKVNSASEAAVTAGKCTLSFLEAHNKVKELSLPTDPFEQHGFSETDLQLILGEFETDQAVMTAAQPIFAPQPQGDITKAEKISMATLLEVHQFMVKRIRAVIDEFAKLDVGIQTSMSGKEREHAAELLVSVEAQAKFKIGAKELDTATILHEHELQQDQLFLECTEQLAGLMHKLRTPHAPAASAETPPCNAGVHEDPPATASSSSLLQTEQPPRSKDARACYVGVAIASALGVILLVTARRCRPQ